MNSRVQRIFKELKKTRNKETQDDSFDLNARRPSLPPIDLMEYLNNSDKSSRNSDHFVVDNMEGTDIDEQKENKKTINRKTTHYSDDSKIDNIEDQNLACMSTGTNEQVNINRRTTRHSDDYKIDDIEDRNLGCKSTRKNIDLEQVNYNKRTSRHNDNFKIDQSFSNIDYSSDDSVLDKNYVPSENDYDSSDSVDDSHHNILMIRNKIEKVKKKLLLDNEVHVSLKSRSSTKKRKHVQNNEPKSAKKSKTDTIQGHEKKKQIDEKEILAENEKKHIQKKTVETPAISNFPMNNPDKVLSHTRKKSKCNETSVTKIKEKKTDTVQDDLITLEDLGLVEPQKKSSTDNLSNLIDDTGVVTAENLTRRKGNMSNEDNLSKELSMNTSQPSPAELIIENDINMEGLNEVDQQTQSNEVENSQNKTKPVAESETKKNPRKRVRNEVNWKKNKAKKSRLAGSPYVSLSKTKKEFPERQIKEPCLCRMKCYEKISKDDREIIFHHFWKVCNNWDQRRQYVTSNVAKSIKVRSKVNSTLEQDRRKYNYKYSFDIGDKTIPICKVMFLNTLCVGEKFMKICVKKKTAVGLTEPDRRGQHIPANKTDEAVVNSVVNHISAYPSYESHYRRETNTRRYLGPELNISTMYKQYVETMKEEMKLPQEIAKEWLYSDIFNKKFNLAFKLPGQDTCDDCDRFERELKDPQTSEEEKENTKKMKDKHLKESELRYKLKKEDKEASIELETNRVLLLDLQKCFPTPCLTNTQSFYLRKLWTLNLTIYDATTKATHNFMWPENVAGRGGNEIASCILGWAENNLNSANIEDVTTWTDNCAGQNRNMLVVMAYLWMMNKYQKIKIINHKFLLKGHTHMECDHIHAMIERKKKKLKTMEIASPRDWVQFVKTCAGKNPFHVHEMKIDDMKDLSILSKSSGPLVQRKKNTAGNDFKISETVWWQFRREAPNSLFYKTSFSEESFCEVKLSRNLKKPANLPSVLPNARIAEKPISSAKYKDILTLLKWVPREYHDFYKNLPHDAAAGDVPEDEILIM